MVTYAIETLCINMRYNGVKGTGSLVGGSNGGQSPPFLIHTGELFQRNEHEHKR